MTRKNSGEILEAVLQDLPARAQAVYELLRLRVRGVGIEMPFRVFENGGRAGCAKLRQLCRKDAVERGLTRMDALGHVARLEEGIEACRLRAGESERALDAVCIQLERLRRARRGAERAVGRGGMQIGRASCR